MNALQDLERHPQMRFTHSKCPSCGAARKLDMDMTAAAMSNHPREMVHCRAPMRDWHLAMPSPSKNGESSNSGWSFFSSGDCTFCDGVVPKWFLCACSMQSMHLHGPTHSVPLSSQKQSHPRWKSTGPVPLSLKEWGLACGSSMMCCGFFDAMTKLSAGFHIFATWKL